MPRKNLYIPEADAEVWEEAERLAGRTGRGAIGRSLSAVVTELLRDHVKEQKRKEEIMQENMESIRVTLGGHDDLPREAEFEGRWLVEPDPDETRSTEERSDAGTYYGVALTKRGNFAVYTAHVNDGFDATLDPHRSLERARYAGLPKDILAKAAAAEDPDYVQKLDI